MISFSDNYISVNPYKLTIDYRIMRFGTLVFLALAVILLPFLISINSGAHVPEFEEEGQGLDSAIKVDDPLKSWVLYSELHETGEANYYKMDLKDGQRLKLSIITPQEGFTPGMVVMHPGNGSTGTVPQFIEVPNGYGATVINGISPDSADYEPFTPGSYYITADFDQKIDVSGTYFVAVYSNEGKGGYGLAVGYIESFSLGDWVTVPIDAVNIHAWEGQSMGMILSPIIITVGIGFVFLFVQKKYEFAVPGEELWRWLGFTAGLLYIGSGAVLSYQMVRGLTISGGSPAAIVTFIFVLIAVIPGIYLIKKSILKSEALDKSSRMYFVIIGALGFFIWAGYIIGPITAIITGIYPSKIQKN
jgi:hypothetical protein